MITRHDEILIRTFNVKNALDSHPELFNFSRLSIEEKRYLLSAQPAFYSKVINVSLFNPSDKAEVLLDQRLKNLHKLAALSEEELPKVKPELYYLLLLKNFQKYKNKELFDKLANEHRAELFITHPVWVSENADDVPKLTLRRLDELSSRNKTFIEEYITDFSRLSTSGLFWTRMIRYDEKYMEIFLNNTNSLSTKTDVRFVVRTYPEIIKLLNSDNISNSKLSVKEWILLIKDVSSSTAGEKVLKDFVFNDDLIEIFRGDLLAEMLSGKSKMSVRFKNAMKGVFKTEEEI